MEIKVNQGDHMKRIKAKNRSSVKAWFETNPESTITECCKGLGLTYRTVRAGVDEFMAEGEE